MVSYFKYLGRVISAADNDALAHHSMQEGGVAEETVPGSGRGEVGRLQGLQRVWAPPGYGVIF